MPSRYSTRSPWAKFLGSRRAVEIIGAMKKEMKRDPGRSPQRSLTNGWFVHDCRLPYVLLGAFQLLTISCFTASPRTTPATAPSSLNVDEESVKNYDPQVTLQNTLPFAKSQHVPFAHYIVAVHDRLHPIFEEELKAAREAYPELRSPGDLIVNVEIVVAQDDGHLVLSGVAKSSGSLVFDALALSSMRRAAPFGAPPPSIVSADGKVYLHWDLHTAPEHGCSSYNARPYNVVRPPR